MNKTVVLFLFILMMSCQSLRVEEVAGIYSRRCHFEMGSELELKEDSTFTYNWQQGLTKGKTAGTWQINKNKLQLDSYKTKACTASITEVSDESVPAGSMKFTVFLKDEEPCFYALLSGVSETVDTTLSAVTGIDGTMVFPTTSFDTVIIQTLGYKVFKAVDLSGRAYKIQLCPKDPQVFFDEAIWKIKDQKLIDPKDGKLRCTGKTYYQKE